MAKPPLSPEQIQARLLYRDGLILVLDKPAGLPVHAGPGAGPTWSNASMPCDSACRRRRRLAHRLDRDTSGCLVLGRHRKALSKLGRLFQGGLVDKTYWAVVVGAPAQARAASKRRCSRPRARMAAGAWWSIQGPAGRHDLSRAGQRRWPQPGWS